MSKKGFTYTLKIDAEIQDLVAKTKQVKESMQSIMDAGKAPGAEKIFGSIEKAIDKLQSKASKPIESLASFESLQKDAMDVSASLSKLGNLIENLGKMSTADKIDLLPPDLKKQVEGVSAALNNFAKVQGQASQKSQELVEAEKDLASAQKELKRVEGRVNEKKALIEAQKQLVDGAHAEAAAIKEKLEALKKYQTTAAAYEEAGGDKRKAGGGKAELEGMNLPADRRAATKLVPDLDLGNAQAVADTISRLGEEYVQAKKNITDVESTQRKYTNQLSEASTAATVASAKVNDLEGNVQKLNKEFEQNKAKNVQTAYTQLRNEANRLGVDLTNIPVEYTEEAFNQLNGAMNQLVANGMASVDQGLHNTQATMAEVDQAARKLGGGLSVAGTEVTRLDEAVSNTTAFTERIKQFVGLAGGIEIARRAMTNAFSTIKELDAAMTEMAVVTELDVGDYWDQLPEYTARANALGVSIKSAYESATLFYQQGLKTNEVVAMSNETLKMARIAGLSAEDATNKMTAALRGFNMELNETSAQRVSDVYSELAAITASDVKEISSAMTKTASIAASAGMEFETTAAFLSQIIETTRESAETAGTAMKTVIARFQELKKDPSEIGEVDGEIVDANKIETALRSVGVSLRDAKGQFRELDDVFLELSSKWDSLDTNTQRYIATIAAGSRQQSRFIAMMSDYSRTQELVTAANSSAGASNEQFEKTMNSLGSKLNELKNAWDSFTMGIMDSDVVKAGVDILTSMLTAINNITDAFGDFSGAAKIGLLVSALYLGDKALNVFNKSIKEGSGIFQAFGAIGTAAVNSASKSIATLNKKMQQSNINAQKLANALKKGFTSNQSQLIAKYNKELEKENKLQESYNKIKEKTNLMEKAGLEETERYKATLNEANMIEKMTTAQTEERTVAQNALLVAMGLTDDQQKEAIALRDKGISLDMAATLSSAGYTAAQFTEEAAVEGVTEAEYAEKLAKDANTKSTGLAAVASFILTSAQTLQQKGLKGLIKSWWGQLKAKFADITATWGQVAANTALQVSMWPVLLVTLLIVAAIVALVLIVWLVVAAFKAWKASTPEGKLKSAEEAADAAAEAAERTAEAYNNLVDAVENLSDKYAALEDMTRNTQEWRDAVKEVNDEVLSLIEEYPELAGLVESKGGVLTLDLESQEVQEVLNKYEKQASAAQSASLAAKINVNEKKANVTATDLVDANVVYEQVGERTVVSRKLSAQTIQEIANAMNKGDLRDTDGDGKLTTEMQDWLETYGTEEEAANASKFANALANDIEALKEFGTELYAMSEQERVYNEQMAQNAIGLVDATKYTEEQMKQMDVAATADYAKTFNKASQAELEKAIKEEGINGETFKKAKEEVAKNLYGKDATVSGNTITYKDENGEEKTKELTDEEFKEQWAAIDATRNMTAAFEQLPKTINKISAQMSSEVGKAFKAMYAGKEGSAMTKADIEAASQVTQGELVAIWSNLTEEEKKAYGSFESLQKQYNDSVAIGNKALEQAQEASANAGIALMEDVTMEAAKGYAEKMRSVYTYDATNVEKLTSNLEDVIGTLNKTDKINFISALNALDWNSVASIESLPDTLEQIGISVPQDELQEYLEMLKESAGAIKNIDLEKLQDAATTLANIKLGIGTQEQNRSFSEETYKTLIEMDPKLAEKFQLGLDGQYIYLGDSIQELIGAINENTTALLSETSVILENKLAMSKIVDNISVQIENGGEFSFSELNSLNSEEAQKNALKELQKQMNEAGAQIVGIEGFSNWTPIDNLNGEELDKIISQIVTTASNASADKEKQRQQTIEIAAVEYQGYKATQNVSGANLAVESKNADEFDARSRALVSQAVGSGVSSVLIDEYAELANEYKATGKTSKEFFETQRKLANSTDYLKMRQGLQGVFEKISEVKDQYDSLADTDLTGKLNVVNQALAEFGIQIDEASNPDEYMDLVEQLAQGNADAMEKLVGLAQKAAGVPEEFGNAYSTKWSELTAEQIAFFDRMQANSLGYWEALEDDSRQFVWATIAEMESIAEAAGTAVEEWENPYTWLYNYNEKINQLVREREKSERAYTKALEDETVSAEELLQLSQQQLGVLQEEVVMQTAGAARALDEIEQQFKDNSQFKKYVQFDATTSEIVIDYEKLDKAGFDEETGAKFEEFVSAIEENREIIIESEERLEEISDEMDEIKNRGKDETSNLYNQIKEGLIQSRQEEIDALQNINDSIENAQSALVEQMQKQIDEARQARENEKTENSIVDKETRLAYLMRDTSGGNATEIQQLRDEIANEKEGYTDSLVDQQLQKLQEVNERAAQQRQQQIDIAQAQLDAYANSAQVWLDTQEILNNSLIQAKASSNFNEGWMNTQAAHLSGMAAGIDSLNPIEKDELMNELTTNAKLAGVWTGAITAGNATLEQKVNDAQEILGGAQQEIKNIKDSAGDFGKLGSQQLATGLQAITGGVGNKGANLTSVVEAITGQEIKVTINNDSGSNGQNSGSGHGSTGQTSGSTSGEGGKTIVGDKKDNFEIEGGKTTTVGGAVDKVANTQTIEGGVEASMKGFNDKPNKWFNITVAGETDKYVETGNVYSDTAELDTLYRATYGEPGKGAVVYKKNHMLYVRGASQWYQVLNQGANLNSDDAPNRIRDAAKKWRAGKVGQPFKYKTGGLADFTGPAWLDGTKSKPEIVLNQTDSANFIQLRDILADILNGTSNISKTSTTEKGGDNYYDIEISVDSLGNDYDVEQLASKIKSMIYEDSTYRNVNSISGIR